MAAQKYPELEETADGVLANVILLDQFTRNSFRGAARAYAYDAQCQALVKRALDRKLDLQLAPVRRVFCYMPLMHAESMSLQDLSLAKFTALVDENPQVLLPSASCALACPLFGVIVLTALQSPHLPFLQGSLQFAQSHRADIHQFGRFPYRNAVLGRTSTEAELLRLKSKSSP